MKQQIFDWLREQIEEKSVQGFDGNGNPVNVRFVASIMAEDIITEAETKWKADCCEWRQEKCLEFTLDDCITSCGHAEHYTVGIDKYCRHCGNRIKILKAE